MRMCISMHGAHATYVHITHSSLQTSQTLNSRFTAIEELAVGSRSPSVPPPHSARGSFNRKLRVVGRGSGGRGQGESVMGQGGRGRGRGQGRR